MPKFSNHCLNLGSGYKLLPQINRVVQSIELLLYSNCTKTVANPHSFIMDCLRFNWQEGFAIYYQPELPKFSSLQDCKRVYP
ncbi:MAG: hypothetical protein AB4368_22055 [Xenococcaceae cyanobacterium]